VKLAAQTVTHPQHRQLIEPGVAEQFPGFIGLGLVIEPRHVAPGLDRQSKAGQ
jgi:hypothetical protein